MLGKSIVALQQTAALERRTSSRIATKKRQREERIQQKRRHLTATSSSCERIQEWTAMGEVAICSDIGSERRLEYWTDGNRDCCRESLENSTAIAPAQSAYARVEETLRIFNAYYRHFVGEEERRCRRVNADDAMNIRKKMNRPDLKALSKMKQSHSTLYPKKIGSLEGIDVGHRFSSRAEMVVVGLHDHWMSGIDFMGASYRNQFEYRYYTFPLAVSVVISGEYEDDLDNLEEVIYTGEGGNNHFTSDRQNRDQTLRGGNLALKNSMKHQIPVRVTRGHVSKPNFYGKHFTYDGLYRVDECWEAKGASGYKVWKFRLKRLPGQPPLTTNQVHFVRADQSPSPRLRGQKPQSIIKRLKHRMRSLKPSIVPTRDRFSERAITYTSSPAPTAQNLQIESPSPLSRQKILEVLPTAMRPPGTVISFISEGQVKIPISASESIDDSVPPVPPTGYKYCNTLRINKPDVVLPVSNGCTCEGNNCSTDPSKCECASLSRLGLGFSGRSKKGKEILTFECSRNCRCGPSCTNKTYDQGLRYRLEVFHTTKKRWGLRSWDPIRAGSVVCECTGVLKRTGGLSTLGRSDFVLGIDWLQQTQKESGGSGHRGPEFCVDARKVGNVARFINHSCRPNVFLQLVLGPSARILVLAADDIAPLQELTYDSCFAVGGIVGHDGQIRRRPCCCGEPDCRRR